MCDRLVSSIPRDLRVSILSGSGTSSHLASSLWSVWKDTHHNWVVSELSQVKNLNKISLHNKWRFGVTSGYSTESLSKYFTLFALPVHYLNYFIFPNLESV